MAHGLNVDGTIHADVVYTEHQLMLILGIRRQEMLEYYKDGLRYYQRNRKSPRLIPGSEWHRFVERRLREWHDENEAAQ